MPLYDFQCPLGHKFEKVVPLALRDDGIACEAVTAGAACSHEAQRVEISHARPSTMLERGYGRNRDDALAGRYDPSRPSTRGVRK